MIPNEFDPDRQRFLNIALGDIGEINAAIEEEDEEELADKLSSLGGYLLRHVNSDLFVQPLFNEYPKDLRDAAREFIQFRNSAADRQGQQIMPMFEGELRRMMAGEVDLPTSMSDARPATRRKLENYGVTNEDIKMLRPFLESWTGRWIAKGSNQFNKLEEKIKEVTRNKDRIRSEIYKAIPEVRKDLELAIAARKAYRRGRSSEKTYYDMEDEKDEEGGS
jgi:hypothetical protein